MRGETEVKGETEKDRKGPEKLLDAIGELPEEMVAEAADEGKLRALYRQNRRHHFLPVGRGLAVAAVIGVVVWGVYAGTDFPFPGKGRMLMEKAGQLQDNTSSGYSFFADTGESASEKSATEGSGADISDTDKSGTDRQEENRQEGEALGVDSAREAFGIGILSPKTEKALEEGSSRGKEGSSGRSVFVLGTTASGTGKKAVHRSEIILGQEGEQRSYSVSASGGISLLTASSAGEKGEETDKNNEMKETGTYHCASGTQLVFSFPDRKDTNEAARSVLPQQIQEEWDGLGIRAVGCIEICVEEDGENKTVTIVVGKSEGKYYAQFIVNRE